jgi:hypothetical protein
MRNFYDGKSGHITKLLAKHENDFRKKFVPHIQRRENSIVLLTPIYMYECSARAKYSSFTLNLFQLKSDLSLMQLEYIQLPKFLGGALLCNPQTRS